MRRPQKSPAGYRLFLATSLPMGLLTGLLLLLWMGPLESLLLGVLAALLFGLMMTAVLSVSQAVAGTQGGKVDANLDVRQTRTFPVLGSKDEVVQHTKAAFELLGVRSFDILDANAGVLAGHTAFSVKSFGERLHAVIKPGREVCEVTITSEPRLSTTLVDYGKNLQNIEAIQRHLHTEGDALPTVQSRSTATPEAPRTQRQGPNKQPSS